MIDTHSHIYAEEFDKDRDETIERAKVAGVEKIILPNVDSDSLQRMLDTEKLFPDYCYAAIGLHPTSVGENVASELARVRSELECRKYIAIGEIGIDLYWDKTFRREQIDALHTQLDWALEFDLPVIIHVRDSHLDTIEAMKDYSGKGLRGVFHCFTGSHIEAEQIFALGNFMLGIGGVVSFKNSGLSDNLRHIPLNRLVLETDAPYLAPTPHRGKRNEPAYLSLVRDKLSQIYEIPASEINRITTKNAKELFSIEN